MAETITVRTPDGRDLEVLQLGPADGAPFVLHLGTPSAAHDIPQTSRAARERGLRTVIYSRPGYATSTPAPGRSVADAAADTSAVLDALDLDRFVTLGWSGGGPHALACAALLPDRCLARPRWPGSRRTRPTVWTGWPGWATRTSRNSARRSPARRN